MSRLISDILNAPEPQFSRAIQSWERLSNNAGHDIRLISDITSKRKGVLKELGLDESDTTPRELYYALRHKAVSTNKKLEEKLAITTNDSPNQLIEKIIKYVNSLNLPSDTWSVKPSIIKRMLKKQIPKKTLKALGLRSIDSVLKRSNPAEILAVARRLEGVDWQKKLNQQIKNLSVTDFQSGKIHIINVGTEKAEKMRKSGMARGNAIAASHETGSILVVPPARRFEMDCLGLALLLIHEIVEAKAYSTYFRHISVKNEFGQLLLDAITKGLPGKIPQTKIGWKPLQKHLNRHNSSVNKIEHPYLQEEHLAILPIRQIVESNLPDGKFWQNGYTVFMNEADNVASMHPMDVVINASNQLPYENGINFYLKNSIWEELGERYLQSEPIEAIVIAEINGDEA